MPPATVNFNPGADGGRLEPRTALAYMASASRPGCVSEELRSIPQKNQTDSGKDQSFCRSKQVLKKKLKKKLLPSVF
jgi:hypothetical protein